MQVRAGGGATRWARLPWCYRSPADGDVGGIRLHPERNYYYALGLNRLADNPKLIENPGY